MKSFILNRFRSEKVAETAHLPFRHREALCSNINHPRKTLEVKTWQRLRLLAELTLCTFYANINLYNVFSLFLLAKQFKKCSTYFTLNLKYYICSLLTGYIVLTVQCMRNLIMIKRKVVHHNDQTQRWQICILKWMIIDDKWKQRIYVYNYEIRALSHDNAGNVFLINVFVNWRTTKQHST